MKTRVYHHNLDSTKLEYERLAGLGQGGDRWLIQAGSQNAGMGRDGNSWYSPPGGLWLSFDLIHPSGVASFPLYVGFCLWQLLSELFKLQDLRVKWPNDLYLDGKKLAGILCLYQANHAKYIIGVGMNTNVIVDEIINTHNAASLCQHLGMSVSNEYLSRLIVRRVEKNAFLLDEPKRYLSKCAEVFYGLGKEARVKMGKQSYSGVIAGLTEEGYLLLRQSGGELKEISHGSLRLL
ncbi:MAG: biotin--[acetyl-CoA-carboxylase] ligase [Candidatus Cloacimonadaceae bacterium]|jgi:BirA family biotin operon repressor/biotin-[acetyl-CoA-carboxylase] ligase|nr:biotin--[acetyl-CoA-carboxylase] ligase [Candidatus Cloacimonadota bacterium]MDX9949849.1 biotin--[acetyl-CoA-carboxylase] ligase [Candidatus Syntrophosphaera sp.]